MHRRQIEAHGLKDLPAPRPHGVVRGGLQEVGIARGAAGVGAGKEEVLPPKVDRPQGLFGGIVVDLEMAVRAVAARSSFRPGGMAEVDAPHVPRDAMMALYQ